MATLNIPDTKLLRIRTALLTERIEWSRNLSGDTSNPSPYDQCALTEIAEIDDCLVALGLPFVVRTGTFLF